MASAQSIVVKDLMIIQILDNDPSRYDTSAGYAEMSEWSNEHDWKSCDVQASAGSNPVLCAI